MPLLKFGRAVVTEGHVVVKRQDPGPSRRERLRTLAGRRVGEETGLFTVPEIVAFDDDRGEIVFERLHATKLRHALADPARAPMLVGRAASALAAIHGRMESDTPAAGRDVPLHGDFGLNNVFALPGQDRIAIIDWAAADWIGLETSQGAPEIDVAVFLLGLFYRRLFDPVPISGRRALARHFLATYAAAGPAGLDVDGLRAIVRRLAPAYVRLNQEFTGHVRALVRRHSLIDLDLFLRRLSKEHIVRRTTAGETDPMPQPRAAMPYTDRHKGRGDDYDETFSPEVNPYRAMVWRLEQAELDRILRKYLAPGRVSQLDFACGTGRILGHLRGQVASAVGVDVSSSMLERARRAAPDAELIEADLTREDVLGERRFDLITAFRFFPNAEPELRQAVFRILARHLGAGGILVFNNHKHRDSLRRRIARARGREVARGTMTRADAEALAAGAGLRILEVVPLACLPLSEERLPLPVALAEYLERRLSGRPAMTGIAQDLLYVCAPA